VPVVVALLDRRPALLALRRAFPRSGAAIRSARSAAHLEALLHREPVEAVMIGAAAARSPVLDALRADYATLPVILFAPIRSDDSDLLRRAARQRVAAVAVEGLDEPVLGRLVAAVGTTARRRDRLLPLGTAAGLTAPLQRQAWAILVEEAPTGMPAATLAQRLHLSRETLVRQFAAAAAPSLKRATDFVRVVTASQILGSAGYTVADAATMLGFSSPSLLHRTARRLFGAPLGSVADASDRLLLRALRGPVAAPPWQ
jgi:AraC-like DNA-binding protein